MDAKCPQTHRKSRWYSRLRYKQDIGVAGLACRANWGLPTNGACKNASYPRRRGRDYPIETSEPEQRFAVSDRQRVAISDSSKMPTKLRWALLANPSVLRVRGQVLSRMWWKFTDGDLQRV